MKQRITIRPVRETEEYHACERIQQSVWQFGEREVIPLNELLSIQRHGGLVLGAFTATDKIIGFAFGFPGLKNSELIHVSRMVAVLPVYRNSDIGYRLKLAQRAFVLKQGIKLATWTFDPLQSINAYFNIEKLGVVVREYHVNIYGASLSVLNRGFATDRFQAEWWVASPRVKQCLKRGGVKTSQHETLPYVLKCRIKPNGLLMPGSINLNLSSSRLTVEIPSDIMKLKAKSPRLARQWRTITRKIFLHYFNKSYIVTAFITRKFNNQRRSFYILTKK